jgi:Tfp pilus assembly protein PilF
VVYQTSGRHRLAVKLFAKAIGIDDLDAGFHYNIACSYQAMGEQGAAAEHFRTAIMFGMGGAMYVFTVAQLRLRFLLQRLL